MKKSLKVIFMALTCLMSVQVASVFAMGEEQTNKSYWQKTKASFTKWQKKHPKVTGAAISCWNSKTLAIIVDSAIIATGLTTAAILKSKKLAIFTGIFTFTTALFSLKELGLDKSKKTDTTTIAPEKNNQEKKHIETSKKSRLSFLVPSEGSLLGKTFAKLSIFGYGKEKKTLANKAIN